jgi:hypothetical protein
MPLYTILQHLLNVLVRIANKVEIKKKCCLHGNVCTDPLPNNNIWNGFMKYAFVMAQVPTYIYNLKSKKKNLKEKHVAVTK